MFKLQEKVGWVANYFEVFYNSNNISLVNIRLIGAVISIELLPEEEAKIFVIPVLVDALFVGICLMSISKKR